MTTLWNEKTGALVAFLVAMGASVRASAQGTGASLASQDTSVPGGTLLMICYIVLWVMIGGYVFFVMRRQKALAEDLERLESRLDEVLGTGAQGDV
ncbi:CcmD family protein [Lujinxingia vulgaris]|nr:CcmD family protein [Lujinxingia vulgaris]